MPLPAPLPSEAVSPRRAVVTGMSLVVDGGLLLGAQQGTAHRGHDWRSP